MLVCAVAPVSGSCFSSAVALGGVWCFHRVISGCLQLQAHRKKTKIKLCARVCVCARSPPARGTPARGTVKCAGVNKQGLAVASAVLAGTRLPDPRARLPVGLSCRDGPWLASHIQKTLSPPWATGPTGAVVGGFSARFFLTISLSGVSAGYAVPSSGSCHWAVHCAAVGSGPTCFGG